MLLSKVFGNFIRHGVTTTAEETFGFSQEVVDEDGIERFYQVSWNPTVKLHRLGKSNFVFCFFLIVFVFFVHLLECTVNVLSGVATFEMNENKGQPLGVLSSYAVGALELTTVP